MLKWFGRIALGIVMLALLAVAGVYAASEVVIRKRSEAGLPVIQASTDPGAVARGAYQARIRGCDGCHTRTLQGEKWVDDTAQGRIWTTNLTRVLDRYSDAQLARAVRSGVRADGTPLWLMPSNTWATLSDQDTADIVAWLRSHSAAGEPTPPIRFGPLMRLAIVLGRLEPATAHVEAAKAKPAFDAGAAFAHGRYLAMTTCGECHGSDLGGAEVSGSVAPDLVIATAYDAAQFDRFMRTGIAPDGRPRGFMSEMAREHFATIKPQDLEDIRAYLGARAEQMPQR